MAGDPKRATYQDVVDAPANVVAELIDGVLYTHARPRLRHARAAISLATLLCAEQDDRLGRAGGWLFLFEPELHLGDDVLVPDIAAWRADRYPAEEPDAVSTSVAPDWICEVLSPSTAREDRALKLPLYASAGVEWAWLLDPEIRTLEVYRRAESLWQLITTHTEAEPVRIQPFEGLALPLAKIW